MSKLKVEGKAVTRMHDGKNALIRITEVECVDPYDGMVKTLDVDSDICCSMFEPKKEKESFNLNMPSGIISEEEYNELKKSRDGWRMKQMPEFILFQGRILRKDLIKSIHTSYDCINHTLQPAVEFVGEADPLMIGSPVDSPEEALETIYEFYMMLGGDINDVITCREQMKSLLNGEEPMDDE